VSGGGGGVSERDGGTSTARIWVDGEPLDAPAGQSIGAALVAHGRRTLRRSPHGSPRGLYCAIGACQECRVRVEGQGTLRACVTPVRDGMRIRTDAR
jgi:D-hydroxyproline dehydrogenase subunit gamma